MPQRACHLCQRDVILRATPSRSPSYPPSASRRFSARSGRDLANNLHSTGFEITAQASSRVAVITNRGTPYTRRVPMTIKLYPEKSADLPPKGASNPDPITARPAPIPSRRVWGLP